MDKDICITILNYKKKLYNKEIKLNIQTAVSQNAKQILDINGEKKEYNIGRDLSEISFNAHMNYKKNTITLKTDVERLICPDPRNIYMRIVNSTFDDFLLTPDGKDAYK